MARPKGSLNPICRKRGHDTRVSGRNKFGVCSACIVDDNALYYKENTEKAKEASTKNQVAKFERAPWYSHFVGARYRCTSKKDKNSHNATYKGLPFTITEEDVRGVWIRDKASQLKEPSIDKIVDALGYVPENIRFIEMDQNRSKRWS